MQQTTSECIQELIPQSAMSVEILPKNAYIGQEVVQQILSRFVVDLLNIFVKSVG